MGRSRANYLGLGVTSLLLIGTIANAQGSVWQLVAATGPSDRSGHGMTYDTGRGQTVIFGGSCVISGCDVLGDTWEWNGTAWLQKFSSGPSARTGHALAYDVARARTVLFGGVIGSIVGPSQFFNETWIWDGVVWSQSQTNLAPSPRSWHSMAYDAQRQKVVLFGGYGPTGAILGDTWEWDGQSWAGVSASGPAPRLGHAVAYDAGRRKTVLFGGFTYGNGNPHFADTWEWDGQAWTAVAANGPSARAQHAMAYHAPLGGAISYGGSYFSTFFADTWLFNGNSWSQIINGPAARERSAIAYDAARARTVMFGGSGGTNSALASTYEMRGGINSASATPFGTGCSGSSGVPALVNSNGSLPRPGGSLQLAVTNLPPIATVCTPFFGTSNQWFNATQLPAPLEAYGMPGCTLYADVFGTGFALSLGGTATWSFSLPLNGNLVGLHVYVQALVFDPNASNPAGIATTNAIDALIGA